MRDDRTQALGRFDSGLPQARGSLLRHEKLVEFIQRNYQVESRGDDQGQWYFQNGPQRVYVELEATPFIWRLEPDFCVRAHTGQDATCRQAWLDETGCLYLETDLGFGLVHTADMVRAADAVEAGLWTPQPVLKAELPGQFGFVCSPAAAQAAPRHPD
jgi:hypothetical protein